MQPYPNNQPATSISPQQLKRRILFISIGTLLLFLGLAFYHFTNVATLVISSDPNVEIAIARTPSGNFEVIGQGEATYKTRDPGSVYVRGAHQDVGVSIKTVSVALRNTTNTTITLEATVSADRITEKALVNFRLDNNFAYGISPATSLLDYAPRRAGEVTNFFFFGLPRLNQVAWVDADTMIARSVSGIGVIDKGVLYSLQDPSRRGQSAINFDVVDFTLLDSGAVGYLTRDSFVIKPSAMSPESEVIDSYDRADNPRVFSDAEHIYLLLPDVVIAEAEGAIPEIVGMELRVYSHSGEHKNTFEGLDFDNFVDSVSRVDDQNLLMAGGDQYYLVSLETGNLSTVDSYFQTIVDMLPGDNGPILLNELGVWRYDHNEMTHRLLYAPPEGSVVTPRSLQAQDGGTVLFSLSRSVDSLRANQDSIEGIFQISP